MRPIYQALKRTALAVRLARSPFVCTHPPGHFYSPLPAPEEIPESLPIDGKECPGVDLREDAQLALLDQLAFSYGDMPFEDHPSPVRRYHFDNEWFSYCDATVLHTMLRHYRPRQIIEVGSGFSSAVILDTRDRFLDANTWLTFIDPYPERLQKLLRFDDVGRCEVLARNVQQVDVATFDVLAANDMLFVDSSHVLKLGSDVAWIVFAILPRLASGVIIHFHDILWPFEYPLTWLHAGRAWNEAYFLRAFLQYNDRFEIVFFNDFMKMFHADALRQRMPMCLRESSFTLTRSASSLWIAKR